MPALSWLARDATAGGRAVSSVDWIAGLVTVAVILAVLLFVFWVVV